MASIRFTPPVSNAFLSEIVPFYAGGGTTLNLLLLWDVGNGSSNAPPQILQYDPTTQTFFDDTSNMIAGSVPNLPNPRNVTVANLNGYGPSFIIAESGLDQSPWPGTTNTLLLATSDGKLTDASASLPQTLAFSHDVSSGIIDGSGHIGVFFNNLFSQQHTPPYYLISNGNGTFTDESSTFLPSNLLRSPPPAYYTASALLDLTGNGLSDLILGAADIANGKPGPSLVYLNPGNGDFHNVTPIDLPGPPLPPSPGLFSSTPTGPSVLDIQPIHLSSPNYDDLVVISTNGIYEAYSIQILINDGTGHFTDQSTSRIIGAPSAVVYPSNSSRQTWLVRSFIVNLNGYPDIVTQSFFGAPSQVFLNNGNGDFYLAYSVTNSPIMAVATIGGTPTLVQQNGNLVPYEAPPSVTAQTPTQTWIQGRPFTYTLPSNTFTDPRGEHLSYAAGGPGGASLPNWLSFNPTTATFSGTVPTGTSPFSVTVTAIDTDGWMTEEVFNVATTNNPPAGTTADMILRHGDGTYEIYDIGNNSLLAAYPLGTVGTDWQFVGLGGFFDSDTTDMILRNSNTGGFEVYDIANNNITNAAFLGNVGMDWQVMGFGNFSSLPGETDMILRNSNNGGVEVYDISNNQITGAAFMGAVGLNWQFSGVGNFSGHGESDMILRNSNTGGLEVYDIANNQLTGAAFIGNVGVEWQFSGVGNFSSVPGETDLLLRNANTGGLELYDINDNQLTGAAFIGTVGLDWQFAGIAAANGAGTSDLVLRNVNSGAFEVYDIANNQLTGAASLGSVGLDWQMGGFAADPPTTSMGGSDSSTSQLVQAMAGFGGGSGAADGLNAVPPSTDTSQQTLLTTPQHA